MVLNYSKPHYLSKLHDELLAAVPAVRPVNGVAVMLVEGDGATVRLTVPDALAQADVDAIAAIVAAHDATPPPPPPDPDAELAQAIEAATTIAGLKAALLGRTRAGAVKGRRP